MLEWLKSMLSDNSGGASTMRVCLLMWMLVLCFNITYGTIKEKPFPITGELVALTACIMGAKAIQRFGEKTEITFDSNGQIAQASGVNFSSLPLTVSVQGSVPISGNVPIQATQQQQQPTTISIGPPAVAPTPVAVVQPPTGVQPPLVDPNAPVAPSIP